MAQAVRKPRPNRRRHPVPTLLLMVACLVGLPRIAHPEAIPLPASRPEIASPDALQTLVANLNLEEPTPQPTPDRHVLRAPVVPFMVRLAVDPRATHPESGPVPVRRLALLGSPGQRLRVVCLSAPPATPEPAPRVAALAARHDNVKNPSTPSVPAPTAAGSFSPAPSAKAGTAVPGRCVLVAGDSLSMYLAEALRPMLAGRPGTAFIARGKIASGLARPDFFDWEREMTQLAATHRPDTVIVMIAANDNKTMTRPDGVKVAFGRPSWEAEYTRRIQRFVELSRRGNPNARIYWVGAPVMADPRLNADVAAINAVIARQLATLPGCHFVDVSRTLADAAGRYVEALPTPGGPRPARTKDGVHLAPFGARLLAHATLASMSPTVAELNEP